MPEDPPARRLVAARPTTAEVAEKMNAAIAAARGEGIAVPLDLARRAFAVTRKLAVLANEADPE